MAITYCDYCNNKIEKYQYLIDKGDHNFCNYGCSGKFKKGIPSSEKQKIITSKRMIGNKYGLNKEPGNKKYNVDKEVFKNIKDEESAYWFGYILADGCINLNNGYRFEIVSIDKNHLYKLKDFIKYTGPIRSYKEGIYNLLISDKDFVNRLINIGIIPRKTFKVTFPNNIPNNLLNHFIRGYLDADGSLSFLKSCKYHKVYFSLCILGTEKFIEKLSSILKEKCNLKSSSYYFVKRSRIFALKKSAKQAIKICEYLYKDSNIYLERKYKKYMDYIKYKETKELYYGI